MTSLQEKLLKKVTEKPTLPRKKVTVIGLGQVGKCCAFSLILKNVVNELALVDTNANKLEGELLDLKYGAGFYKNVLVSGSTDYAITAHSKVCIIAVGHNMRGKDTQLELIRRNADMLRKVVPQLIKYSPDTILIIATNPVDIMSYLAWKISKLPQYRVFGTGTSVDTSRFRVLLSDRLRVSPLSIHGWIIGEQGDSSVPVWSGVEVASVRLRELNPDVATSQDKENWEDVYQQLLDGASELMRLKGYSSWGGAVGITTLVDCILRDANRAYAVSTRVKGFHGIVQDVFLSLPCLLGQTGITDVIVQILSEDEREKLMMSATLMQKMQADAGIS